MNSCLCILLTNERNECFWYLAHRILKWMVICVSHSQMNEMNSSRDVDRSKSSSTTNGYNRSSGSGGNSAGGRLAVPGGGSIERGLTTASNGTMDSRGSVTQIEHLTRQVELLQEKEANSAAIVMLLKEKVRQCERVSISLHTWYGPYGPETWVKYRPIYIALYHATLLRHF